MIPNGKPENLSPIQREEIISSHRHRKIIRQVLHGIAGVCILLGIAPYQLESSLLGLSPGTELGIFFGIAAIIFGASVLFWRCPYCSWHFLWRMSPEVCWNCGAQLVDPPQIPEEKEEKDFRYYIKVRQRNSLKYYLYSILVLAVDILLLWAFIHILPPILTTIIFLGIFMISGIILDNKYHVCPRCGEKYSFYGSYTSVPQECSRCKTLLKHYPRDTYY